MNNIPKKGGSRKASRPADQVFVGQMENAYQTALNLISKAKRLSRHRALRYNGGDKLAATFNRFLARVGQEIEDCTVKPGATEPVEETPTLSEFIGS